MNEKPDLEKIRQKVNREIDQDGIIEIWMGIFFLFYAVCFDNLARGIKISSTLVVFMIIISLYPLIYFKILRNSFTYPRIGYVKLNERKIPRYAFSVILPLILLPIIMYITSYYMSHIFNIELIIRAMSVAFGLVLGALFLHFVKKYGKPLYIVFSIFFVSIGILLSLITLKVPGVTILLIIVSFTVLCHGVYSLICFLRKYPNPKNKKVKIKGFDERKHGAK